MWRHFRSTSQAQHDRNGRMQRRPGFTLIELLVVVAIIALLIAILLPSLGLSRRITRRTACAANLRAIGQGLYVYADQFNRALPHRPFQGSAYAEWWMPTEFFQQHAMESNALGFLVDRCGIQPRMFLCVGSSVAGDRTNLLYTGNAGTNVPVLMNYQYYGATDRQAKPPWAVARLGDPYQGAAVVERLATSKNRRDLVTMDVADSGNMPLMSDLTMRYYVVSNGGYERVFGNHGTAGAPTDLVTFSNTLRSDGSVQGRWIDQNTTPFLLHDITSRWLYYYR